MIGILLKYYLGNWGEYSSRTSRFQHACLLFKRPFKLISSRTFTFFFLVVLTLSNWNCNTTKFLAEDDFLLTKNKIKFKGNHKIKNLPALKYELSLLCRPKVNSNLMFFIPREWVYFKFQDTSKQSKFRSWINRVVAEQPAIYRDEEVKSTVERIRTALYRKGYYNAIVYDDDTNVGLNNRKKVVTYYVNPQKQFTIDSTFFHSENDIINDLLKDSKGESYLGKGAPLDAQLYIKERDRIVKTLQDNGFAYFIPNYISPLEADTTVTSKKANIYLNITPPFGDSVHQRYRIGNIKIFPSFSPILDEGKLKDSLINGYQFLDTTTNYAIKPETIIKAISLKPGALYQLSNYENTNRRLSALGVYKFVRIRQEIDSIIPYQLNFRIELSPNKKNELGLDFELNYTSNNRVARTDNLFGITASPVLRNRNVLGGAESLVTNLTGGIEFNPAFSGNRFWNTAELGVQSELFLPKFIDYLGIWKGINNIEIGEKITPSENRFYTNLRESALSRLALSYNYVLVLNFYRYNLFNASFGYDFQRSNTHRYIVNHIGLDYLFPIFEPALDEIFETNQFFERSFGRQLFTSFLLRDFNYIYNSRVNDKGQSNYFSFGIETAGGEVWAINQLYNTFSGNQENFSIGDVDFSQYVQFDVDYRFYKQITPKQSWATRLYLGISRPFGNSLDVPYVKQFAAGGPNSIRGWVQRALGPGGYIDPIANELGEDGRYRLDNNNRFSLYQQGDFQMEFSFEYRFNLYWLVDGAVFIDAGNVWTINEDPTRYGSQFLFQPKYVSIDGVSTKLDPFYKQIALSSGFGLRFDLSYVIMRLDLGLKLRYPFPFNPEVTTNNAREADYWESFNNWKIRDVNFNLGFGYPF